MRPIDLGPCGSAALATLVLALTPLVAQAQDRNLLDLLPTDDRALEAGSVVIGELTADDYVIDGDDERGQAWAFQVPEAGLWRVDLGSGDFDAFVRLNGPGIGRGFENDDGGPGTDARICAELDPGEYRVVVSSLFGGLGIFELRAARIDDAIACGDAGVSVPSYEVTVDELPVRGSLTVGDVVDDVLTESFVWDDRAAQLFTFEGRAGERVVLDLDGDFDTVLSVFAPGATEPQTDDDGGCGTGSRLAVRVGAAGTYRVVVAPLFGGTGAYTLRVVEDASELPECVTDEDPFGFSGRLDVGDAEPVGRVTVGERVEGELGPFSDWIVDASADLWTLSGEAGQRIAISVDAGFDPQVYLLSDALDDDYFDDDGGEGLNSRLCTILPETGEYTILVRGFDDEPQGPYVLSIDADPSPGSCEMQLRLDQRGGAPE